MRIGIVGSGIAGLTSAWLLRNAGHDVTIFEKQPMLGMDAQAVEFEHDGEMVRPDVPSRMFNELQWPNLFQLYRDLGVETEPVEPTQSLSRIGEPCFLQLKEANSPQNFLTSMIRSTPRDVLLAAYRLSKDGERDLQTGIDPSLRLRDYLRQNEYSDRFVFEFLYPTLSSTVCTCSYASLDDYPAQIVLEALRQISGARLMKTRLGTRDVVSRLISNGSQVLKETTVESIEPAPDGVLVDYRSRGGEFQRNSFAHLVIATQANQVAMFTSCLSAEEKSVLNDFRYEDIRVVVHADRNLMPPDQNHWSTFNMISDPEKNTTMCSVWLNRFHQDGLSEGRPVFQTIKPIIEPHDESLILDVTLQRPIVTRDSYELWHRILELHRSPGRRIWFCGSYASAGIPLLESAVVSAKSITNEILRTPHAGPDLSFSPAIPRIPG